MKDRADDEQIHKYSTLTFFLRDCAEPDRLLHHRAMQNLHGAGIAQALNAGWRPTVYYSAGGRACGGSAGPLRMSGSVGACRGGLPQYVSGNRRDVTGLRRV